MNNAVPGTVTRMDTCGACNHKEAEHHALKKDWLECLHPGCHCEVYKGFFAFNERSNFMNDREARMAQGTARYGSLINEKADFKCSQCGAEFTKNVKMNPGGKVPIEHVRCPNCSTFYVDVVS